MPRTIDIDPSGDRPEVVLTIGHANAGAFAIYLFEPDRTTFREIGRGTSSVGVGQPFTLGSAQPLPNKILTWDASAIPVTGTRITITLTVLQGGRQVTSFTDLADVPSGKNIALVRSGALLV